MSAHRTLILLRHAKSDYPPGAPDHERPLAPRGVREAGLAGDWLRAHAPAVDAVLCSTATRTRQTYDRTGLGAPVRYVDDLYDATPGTVIATINTVADDVGTLLVVGHEPAMSRVALGLAGPGTDAAVAQRVSEKYPTSGIAVLQVGGSWADVQLRSATLVDFHVPR
ncbi:histidine phosphatase family protein [Mycobacterium sp. UM_Kg1]|uniref:SixA phosphatase family protein n=1 Tax=Mycobacterium sp. UM_Kg1 TaxID=1545691 RepID=UPI00061AC1B8|nr:histidine phosphatase family protein [Mycobacterium sp. UM_Kg1]